MVFPFQGANKYRRSVMKKKRCPRSGFLKLCVLFGLGLGSIGVFLGLVAFGISSRASTLTSGSMESGSSLVASAPDVLADTPTETPTPTPAAGGLVAAYSFDEGSGTTVTDASGYGNTGTI